jgi:hypothetical protein
MVHKPLAALVVAAIIADTALGGFIIFTDQAAFEAFNLAHGKTQKITETFEESNVPLNDWNVFLSNPLEGNVPNVDFTGFGFPTGLVLDNLLIQTNSLGTNASDPSLGGTLRAVGLRTDNATAVSTGFPTDSLDLNFTDRSPTGVGFDVIELISVGGEFHIAVFDKGNAVITEQIVPASPFLDTVFFGIWSDQDIGRINIDSVFAGANNSSFESVDNIQMWVPTPGTLVLLVLAALMGTHRHRR